MGSIQEVRSRYPCISNAQAQNIYKIRNVGGTDRLCATVDRAWRDGVEVVC